MIDYMNKLLNQRFCLVWVGYKGGRATFLAGGYSPYPAPSDINRKPFLRSKSFKTRDMINIRAVARIENPEGHIVQGGNNVPPWRPLLATGLHIVKSHTYVCKEVGWRVFFSMSTKVHDR